MPFTVRGGTPFLHDFILSGVAPDLLPPLKPSCGRGTPCSNLERGPDTGPAPRCEYLSDAGTKNGEFGSRSLREYAYVSGGLLDSGWRGRLRLWDSCALDLNGELMHTGPEEGRACRRQMKGRDSQQRHETGQLPPVRSPRGEQPPWRCSLAPPRTRCLHAAATVEPAAVARARVAARHLDHSAGLAL